MFREMRRKKQRLSDAEAKKILETGSSGVLALSGDDDYPYAVPLSYAYLNGNIYFHCAGTGHKIDAVKKHNRASFCVIGADNVVPEEYTTYYRSVIAFGKIRIVEDEAEKREAITAIALKYNPDDSGEHREAAVNREWKALCILALDVEHLTGKEAIELVRQRSLT